MRWSKGGGGSRDEPRNVLGDRIEVCFLSPMAVLARYLVTTIDTLAAN
jgi:hypothetical protein